MTMVHRNAVEVRARLDGWDGPDGRGFWYRDGVPHTLTPIPPDGGVAASDAVQWSDYWAMRPVVTDATVLVGAPDGP